MILSCFFVSLWWYYVLFDSKEFSKRFTLGLFEHTNAQFGARYPLKIVGATVRNGRKFVTGDNS